jgi:Ni/Fe-hydrogenase subunit HybB-like protein
MNWRIRLTWWDKLLFAIIVAGAALALVRYASGIGGIANINNAYPWGWWVGYGIMTMIAMGGVGFTITALVEILGAHRYHPFLRPAVLIGLLCYSSAILMLMVELGRPSMVWMILISWAPTSALYEAAGARSCISMCSSWSLSRCLWNSSAGDACCAPCAQCTFRSCSSA